jgi:Family of unknown function (DUF5681)
MTSVQNNGGTTGGITGRGFRPGRSGNPGGRPKGLANATRQLVGEDGMALVELWWSIAQDPMQRTSDRLVASRLLADRGWGKAASFEPVDGDPFDFADAEKAKEGFGPRFIGSLAIRRRTKRKPRPAGGDRFPCTGLTGRNRPDRHPLPSADLGSPRSDTAKQRWRITANERTA